MNIPAVKIVQAAVYIVEAVCALFLLLVVIDYAPEMLLAIAYFIEETAIAIINPHLAHL